jgi:DNA primase large subunit
MLLSKTDLAKYPFSTEAGEYVKQLGIRIGDFERPEFQNVLSRAEGRVKESILNGAVSPEFWDADVELLSYPLGLVLVAIAGEGYLKRRHALAEAKRIYSLLKAEDLEKVFRLATGTFGWRIGEPDRDAGSPTRMLKLSFVDYLRTAPQFHDPKWKLVNRVVAHGFVYVSVEEAARLLSEEVRIQILGRLETQRELLVPDILTKKANELLALFKQQRGPFEEHGLPTTAMEEAYPPCIKSLMRSLADGKDIPHMGRFSLTAFLVNAGLSSDDLIALYGSAADFDERMTRYQIEHIAGKKGSRTRYRPPNCDTMKTHGLCLNPDDVCKRVRHPLSYYKRKTKMLQKSSGGGRENPSH